MSHHRWNIAAGIILLTSGLLHLLIWLNIDAAWGGSVSIRKPILFGVSTGLTLISLGWVQQKLLPAIYDAIVSPLFALAMVVEVGLISMQFWRDEASHFNHSTPFNQAVDSMMTGLITFAPIMIFDLTRRSFIFLRANSAMQLAIRAGMGLLAISCGLGFVILLYGEYQSSINQAPEKFGSAGVMKFPHGVVIHAIQFLPMLVWGMERLSMGSLEKRRLLILAIAAMGTFLVFSLVQTFSGRARFDLGLIGGIMLLMTLLLIMPIIKGFVGALLQQIRGRDRHQINSA